MHAIFGFVFLVAVVSAFAGSTINSYTLIFAATLRWWVKASVNSTRGAHTHVYHGLAIHWVSEVLESLDPGSVPFPFISNQLGEPIHKKNHTRLRGLG